jgi:hypothetical protein
MTFSRQNLSDELHQLDVNPLNPDYKKELTKLVIQNLGFSLIGDLNQEQLDEVTEFSKQFHCAIRMRWKNFSVALGSLPFCCLRCLQKFVQLKPQ